MIKLKLKICEGCKQDKYIFKRIDGKPYCKVCASRLIAPKKLKSRSTKKIAEDKEYSILRKKYLEIHPMCQAAFGIGCTSIAIEIHHKEYRGKNTNDIDTWMAVCRHCHEQIHLDPIKARKLDYLK